MAVVETNAMRLPDRWRGLCPSCSHRHEIAFTVDEGREELGPAALTDDREAIDLRERIVEADDVALTVSVCARDLERIERNRAANEPDSIWVYVEEHDPECMPLWGGWEGLGLPDDMIDRLVTWDREISDLADNALADWRRRGLALVDECRRLCPDVEFRPDKDQFGLSR
jgi:hypothetical protein